MLPHYEYDFFKLHIFPALCSFWFLEIIALGKFCICGTLLLTQLMKKKTCAYIGQKLCKWKPL